jgi:hypothetical protein
MPELRVGMPRTGNVLAMMMQQRMREKEPQNVIAQAEVDALKENPNYLNEKYATNAKRDKLQYQKDLIEFGAKRILMSDMASYPALREEMIGYGMSPDIWPQGFENKEAFDSWRKRVIMGAPEYVKMLDGKKFKVSKANDDGTISELELGSPEELQAKIKEGWKLGSMKGAPQKETWTLSKMNDDGTVSEVTARSEEERQAYLQQGYQAGKIRGTPAKTEFTLSKMNDDGTISEVTARNEGEKNFYIGKGFQEGKIKGSSDEPTPAQAFRRISDIYKAMATLGQTNSVTAALVALQPSLKGMIGQKIDANLKAQLDEAWNKEIAYLTQFVKAPDEGTGPALQPEGTRGTYHGKAVVVRQGKWVYAD